MERSSLFKISGLPDAFGAILLILALILLLAPYFSGADFGLFKIPTVTERGKRVSKLVGPVFFIFCILCFVPMFPGNQQTAVGIASANASPSPGPHGEATPSPTPSPHAEAKTLVFDFLAAAPNAKWTSNFGANLLTWSSTAEDSNGFVRYMKFPTLEDGSRPQNVLFTHPQWKEEGHIVGDFMLREAIQPGDRFRAQVGFLEGAGGEVEFVVEAYGGKLKGNRRVHSVRDNGNDTLLRTFDADLTSVAGGTGVRLIVNAETTASEDWAVWVNPRIER